MSTLSPIALEPTPQPMTFVDHLAELRNRLLWCIVTFAITTTVTFFYAPWMIQALKTLVPPHTLFVQLTPGEVFIASIKVSLFSGFGLSLPVLLYHLLRFVSPGLLGKERRWVGLLIIASIGLFLSGVYVAYVGILPLMLAFFLEYGQEVAQNQLSIGSYLDFCTGFLLATGLVFELPLVLLGCGLLGLTSSTQLLQQWRWAVVASFILGGIITPSVDVGSQVVMTVCLLGLYAISILFLKLARR